MLQLELETPVLTGVFDVVGARSDAGLRLQLFPDVGGKGLDMTFCAEQSTIEAEAAGVPYRAAAPLDDAEPHLALLLAALFGGLLQPVTPGRALPCASGSGCSSSRSWPTAASPVAVCAGG